MKNFYTLLFLFVLLCTSAQVTAQVVANNDTATTLQGKPVTIPVLTNDTGNIDNTSVTIVSNPVGGTLQVSNTGVITYIPLGTFTGNDQFQYSVCDNSIPANCANGTVNINVTPNYLDPCDEAPKAKTFYLPFPENTANLYTALRNSANANGASLISNVVRSVTSIKSPYTNVMITYDHWEDGYETDITNPIQSTTQIWGDGILSNGVAPGYPNDILPPGASIVLDDTFVFNPRNANNIHYDGRDKIYSTSDIAVSKVVGDNGQFALQSAKTDVYDNTRFGTSFIIPIGENISSNSFNYTSLFIRASRNNTVVSLDYDGNGSIDQTRTLQEGEVWFYEGTASTGNDTARGNAVNNAADIKAGAVITATQPIGVDVLFGGLDSFGTRNINILPADFYGNTYYTPVGSTSSAIVRAYFYNSLATPITINWNRGGTGTTSGSFNIPANSNASYTITADSGYKFTSSGGQSYTAAVVVDDGNSAYDWAFTLIPEPRLTDFAAVAWAPGSTTNASNTNYNPVWVTPTANTTIYVKYNGDLTATGPNISPCGMPYDISYPASLYSSIKIYNPSGNQSGMAVYSCGTPFAAVYGLNPNGAPSGAPALDVGTIMLPKCLTNLILAGDEMVVTDIDNPIIIGVTSNDYGFLCTVNPQSIVITKQPANGTLTVNSNGTITYTPNPGYQGLDDFDYRICSKEYINTCDTANVRIKVTPCDASLDENLINGKTFLEQLPDDGIYNGESFAPGVGVNLYADNNNNGSIDAGDNLYASTISDLSGNFSFSVIAGSNVKDDFDGDATVGTGNDGGANFASNWVESGDGTASFTAGQVQIITDVNTGSTALRIGGASRNVTRTVAFSGVTAAVLKFKWRRENISTSGTRTLNVTFNGNTVTTISNGGLTTDSYYQQVTIPINSFNASGSNNLVFGSNGSLANGEYFWIDDVEIVYSTPSASFIAQVDTSVSNNRYVSSQLNTFRTIVSGLNNCYKGNYLGVLANISTIDDSEVVNMDTPKNINVLANDFGLPQNSLLTITQQPTNGSVVLNPNGTITYTPNTGYLGTDQFQYRACSADDPNVCDIAMVNLTVQCISVPGQNTINGFIYNDKNNSGNYNQGETGLNAVPVQLYSDSNGNGVLNNGEPLLQTVNSDASGTYSFAVAPPTSSKTYRDEFTTNGGTGNGSNGTVSWASSPWQEIGESNGFATGSVLITSNALRIVGSTRGAMRTADLSNVVGTATLSYSWTRGGGTAIIDVADSPNGTYTTLQTINTGTGTTASFAIPSNRISSTTTIRFRVTSGTSTFTFDNVQIAYSGYDAAKYIVRLQDPVPAGMVASSSPTFYPISFAANVGLGACSNNFGLYVSTNLGVTKGASSMSPAVGSTVAFTITATNSGPANATGVKVTDQLPNGYTFLGASPSKGSYNPTSGEWLVGDLANGATATLTINASVRASGNYQNTAVITGNETDTVLTNNTAIVTPVPSPRADLEITKTVNNMAPNVGSNVVFTLTAANKGLSNATGVKVTDVLPAGYLFVSSSSTDYNSTNGEWTIGNLNNGISVAITITAKVNASGPYQNTATIAGSQVDPVSANNTSSVTPVPVPIADVSLQKAVSNATATIGSIVTFTITVTNNGPSNATGINVRDIVPNGYSQITNISNSGILTGNTINWNNLSLNNGSSIVLTFNAKVLAPGAGINHTNTAEIMTLNQQDPNLLNNTGTDSVSPRSALLITNPMIRQRTK